MTLLELLGQAQILAVASAAMVEESTPDLAADCLALGAQFRDAATRLREEMEFAARKRSANNAVSTRAWELVEAALRSVNGGPVKP